MCIYGSRITFVLFAPVPETGCPMWHAGLTLTLTFHVFSEFCDTHCHCVCVLPGTRQTETCSQFAIREPLSRGKRSTLLCCIVDCRGGRGVAFGDVAILLFSGTAASLLHKHDAMSKVLARAPLVSPFSYLRKNLAL